MRRATFPHALLAACGGFLIATLWFDLMFDTLVLGQAVAPAPLPEAVIASIAGYYRRVTTDAHPMQQMIGAVMAVAVLVGLWDLRHRSHRILRAVALLTSVVPIGFAAVRVFPDAVRLGAGTGSPAEQSALARGIFGGHVFCLGSIVTFTAIQIILAALRHRENDGDR